MIPTADDRDMVQLLRRKLAMLTIAVYWPALFVVTHIPMPKVIDDLDINDKGLHFVAYFSLVFLCWGVVHPYRKVDWRKVSAWAILAIVVWYGVIDEYLQYFVGRRCEWEDFLADLSGALASLFVLSWLPFWPATWLLGSMAIFVAANCARADITEIIPITNNTFHLIAYSGFTGLWLFRLSRTVAKQERTEGSCHWLILGTAVPVFLLASVKAASCVLNRYFSAADVIYSLIGIGGTLGVGVLIASRGRRQSAPGHTTPIASSPCSFE